MFFPPGLPPDVAIEYVKFMNKMRKQEEERKKAEVKQPIPKTFGGLMSYGMYMSYLANQKKN